jgi:hypothetical protein
MNCAVPPGLLASAVDGLMVTDMILREGAPAAAEDECAGKEKRRDREQLLSQGFHLNPPDLRYIQPPNSSKRFQRGAPGLQEIHRRVPRCVWVGCSFRKFWRTTVGDNTLEIASKSAFTF